MISKNFVSIITVNYNGKKYLKNFLDSAFSLSYPKDKYEVIIVDNNSQDGSAAYIKRNFPKVNLVLSKKNLGFAAGNNLGMQKAKGELFFLVNNDTVLQKDSLKNIVSTFKRWNKKGTVGAVNAKMVLIDSYIPLKIKGATFSRFKLSANAKSINKHVFVNVCELSNLYTEKVLIPINNNFSGRLNLILWVKPRNSRFKIFIKEKEFQRGKFNNLAQAKLIKLSLLYKELKKYKVNLIQNAGNFYFRDGHGRDRGTIVINRNQYYEMDKGQYDKEEEIPGFCGAGVLINKEALKDVGYFDESFFMYYEDGDLSLRLKESNYMIVYSPKALIRHIHAGSSGEWSDFFIFNAERGRLLFVAKHWPRLKAVKEWLKYIANDTIGTPLYYLFIKKDKINAKLKFIIRLRVNISIFFPFVKGLARTNRLNNDKLKGFL